MLRWVIRCSKHNNSCRWNSPWLLYHPQKRAMTLAGASVVRGLPSPPFFIHHSWESCPLALPLPLQPNPTLCHFPNTPGCSAWLCLRQPPFPTSSSHLSSLSVISSTCRYCGSPKLGSVGFDGAICKLALVCKEGSTRTAVRQGDFTSTAFLLPPASGLELFQMWSSSCLVTLLSSLHLASALQPSRQLKCDFLSQTFPTHPRSQGSP